MSTKTFTLPEVVQQIAATLKTQIAEYEAGLVSMRKKELERSHGKLAKSELCPLCAGPEFTCKCLLQKSEALGKDQMSANYAAKVGVTGSNNKAKASFGDGPHDQRPAKHGANVGHLNGIHDSSVPKVNMKKDEMGDDGGQSMAMSEACAKCGKSGKECNCMGKMELKTKPDTDIPVNGSGGATKKVPLKKSSMPSGKTPQVQGVAGKQPVGQGGGDLNKAPAQLADAKGMAPAAKWGQEGLPQLKTQLAAVKGGVSWLKSTHGAAHRTPTAQAAPKSQRFHGALPLQRSEKDPDKKLLYKMEDLGKCAMCKSEEHPGKCK